MQHETHDGDQGCGVAETHASSARRETRRRAMLDAAEALFVERGYDRVTLGDVVQRSGGSFATLYALFGGKAGLLRAVVAARTPAAALPAGIGAADDPVAALVALASALHTQFTDPHHLAIMRIVLRESLNDPAFARAFREEVKRPWLDRLAAMLAGWAEDGLAVIDCPRAAAEQLVALTLADAQIQALCGASGPPPDAATLRHRLAPLVTHYRIGGARA